MMLLSLLHCVKIIRIWRFSGPFFPAFRLNTVIYRVNQSECGKIGSVSSIIEELYLRGIHIKHISLLDFQLKLYKVMKTELSGNVIGLC